MKYAIKIGERTYQVEITNLEQRPVVALVDGQPVEVWPVDDRPGAAALPAVATEAGASAHTASLPQTAVPAARAAEKALRAPLPGVIQVVNVKVGDTVTVGQELFVIEAMKMRNAIRSNRSGRVSVLHVTPGQTVNHHDLLLKFDDPGEVG